MKEEEMISFYHLDQLNVVVTNSTSLRSYQRDIVELKLAGQGYRRRTRVG